MPIEQESLQELASIIGQFVEDFYRLVIFSMHDFHENPLILHIGIFHAWKMPYFIF